MKFFWTSLCVGAALLCGPASAQTVSNATPEKAAEIYGALTYLLKADETCALMGVPMRAAAILMQLRARSIGGSGVEGLDAVAEKRLVEVRGNAPCGNFARDPVLLQASNLVRTEALISQLAWEKLLQANGGECGNFISISGKRPALSGTTVADTARRDKALVAVITESATSIRAQFAANSAFAQIDQLAKALAPQLDALACQNPDFSEVLLDYDVFGLFGDGTMDGIDHASLVDDSPWTAITAARHLRSMRDEGFIADADLVVDNSLFAYRNARSNREYTFAVSKHTATWFEADTDDELPAAQVIFGMLTDNRIAIATHAFKNVPEASDVLIETAGTALRLEEIGSYDVPFSDGATAYKLFVLDAGDVPKLMAGETIRISIRHAGERIGNLKEWDFPKTASLKAAIAFATSPQPQ